MFAHIQDKRVRINRSLKTKTTQAFVNLATVLTPTECSKPVLEVYLNQDLIYSNASGRAAEKPDSKEVPKEIIKVHINANMSYFTNSQRKKEYYFSPTEVCSFSSST
ncbi:hypothetical protein JTB14_018222 [Gonioctena quinquepunctata]|nr:hypothetical protein JTB14_018222 [Gonioctena quinquepunctata]